MDDDHERSGKEETPPGFTLRSLSACVSPTSACGCQHPTKASVARRVYLWVMSTAPPDWLSAHAFPKCQMSGLRGQNSVWNSARFFDSVFFRACFRVAASRRSEHTGRKISVSNRVHRNQSRLIVPPNLVFFVPFATRSSAASS